MEKGDQMKIKNVNIIGHNYSIEYVNNPAEVDIYKRESLWGQIDYWTKTIRVYDNGRTLEDIYETVLHEIIEGLKQELNLQSLKDNHDDLTLLAIGLSDTLIRNNIVQLKESENDNRDCTSKD